MANKAHDARKTAEGHPSAHGMPRKANGQGTIMSTKSTSCSKGRVRSAILV
eukprot:CAMPEP_0117456982 /NCGR_PEP_ID=MMETSP0784-20121206/140_1 /TAXON_ID=39447 /ORGANISM="" /LENGTH=50 /DNA_ID=CAMNT_0005250375 /DNA_START=296 /DNA_END=444 /DNA_ORIENTATION=+